MKKIIKFVFGAFLALFVIGCLMGGESSPSSKEAVYVKVGEPLKTSKFEVTVNSVKTSKMINTGNPFTGLKAEDGILYLTIDATFKNIDKESRTLLDGKVIIVDKNGESLKYDHSETVLEDGWGLFLESINPGITKRTKLVYKIPNNLTEVNLYYVPYSAKSNTYITLGSL